MQTLKLTKKYETYPEYKDSGVEWLNNLPTTWKSVPLRSVLYERREKNKDLVTDNILSVMKDIGVIRYEDKGDVGNKSSDNPSNYKIVYPNDIVVNSMNLKIGSVGISKELGVTSSIYIIYRKSGENVLPHFYNYVFMSKAFQKYVGRLGKGIMEIREAIKPIDLKSEVMPLPPVLEQEKIINYLDEKTALIDQIIEKKEKQIELLKEKRSVTISKHIVENTGADWDVKKIKHLVKSIESGIWGDNPLSNEDDIKCLRIADFDYDNFSYSVVETIRNNPKLQERKLLKKGDILMEKSGGGEKTPVGRAILFSSNERMVCANFIDKIRVDKEKILPEFLVLYLSVLYACRVNTKYIKQNTGIQNMDIKEYFGESISYPDIKTQISLTEFVNAKVMACNKAISDVEKTIEILKEFKTSLISNVVTGKIKV